jgi:hypothetical protein
MVMELNRLEKVWFDPYRSASWAVAYAGWPALDIKTQVTLDGDRPMSLSMSVRLLLGTQQVDNVRKTPGRLRFGWLHHENHFIGAEPGTVATADTLIGENLHHAIGVTHNGIAWRAILEARRPFTVTAGDGDMHMGEARARGSIEAGLAMVGRRTGCDTVIAPDTFRLINE